MDGRRIAPSFNGGDRKQVVEPQAVHGLSEEPDRGFDVAAACAADVDQLVLAIHRPPQRSPAATDANVGFVQMPIQCPPGPNTANTHLEFEPKTLHPTEQRRMIDCNPAFLQHHGQVPVADRVLSRPPYRPKHDLRRKPAAFEGRLRHGS